MDLNLKLPDKYSKRAELYIDHRVPEVLRGWSSNPVKTLGKRSPPSSHGILAPMVMTRQKGMTIWTCSHTGSQVIISAAHMHLCGLVPSSLLALSS
jgi:hypothetical protein